MQSRSRPADFDGDRRHFTIKNKRPKTAVETQGGDGSGRRGGAAGRAARGGAERHRAAADASWPTARRRAVHACRSRTSCAPARVAEQRRKRSAAQRAARSRNWTPAATAATAQAETREAVQRYRAVDPGARAGAAGRTSSVGETVAELDAAVARARQTVAQVRQHLEQQAQALRVPAGAPVRGGPRRIGI